jgi:hypothetical protein
MKFRGAFACAAEVAISVMLLAEARAQAPAPSPVEAGGQLQQMTVTGYLIPRGRGRAAACAQL